MTIAELLSGGDPRTLGRVDEAITLVIDDDTRLEELFGCLFHEDPIVRMRAADGLEKVAAQQPELLEPYVDRLLTEVPEIDQPSVQWHLAQILEEVMLSDEQRRHAVAVLKRVLGSSEDWIVLTATMQTLAGFAVGDEALRAWLIPVLASRLTDSRKAVAKRAGRMLERLGA